MQLWIFQLNQQPTQIKQVDSFFNFQEGIILSLCAMILTAMRSLYIQSKIGEISIIEAWKSCDTRLTKNRHITTKYVLENEEINESP